MNIEQVKSIGTTVLGMLGSALATMGAHGPAGFAVSNWETISGVLMSIIVLGYKGFANRQKGVIKAAAGLENVKKVVVDDPVLAQDTSEVGAKVTTQ